jgi:hypothetical protein
MKLLTLVDMMGVEEERLPYPTQQQQPKSLSKKDNLGNIETTMMPQRGRVFKIFRIVLMSEVYYIS